MVASLLAKQNARVRFSLPAPYIMKGFDMSEYKVFLIDIDCGRSGDLSGLYLAKPEALEALNGAIFSAHDVLGKHSEIYFIWGEGEFEPGITPQDAWDVIDLDVLAKSLSPSGESIICLGGFDFMEYVAFEKDDEEEV